MKVNTLLWLYLVSAVLLCGFKFGSSALTSTRRPSTPSPKASSATSGQLNKNAVSRRRRIQPSTNSTVTEAIVTINTRISNKTDVKKTTQLLDVPGPKRKDNKQLDVSSIKKNTKPKKYTPEPKNTSLDNSRGPTKVDLLKPTIQNEKRSPRNPRDKLVCPRESEVKFDLFPIKCNKDKDCKAWNTNEICCDIFGAKSCVVGLPKPLEESSHSPIFGIIPRHCPQRPLAELWWDVKVCKTDMDCWPRVCCPDGQQRYCRTSKPELEIVPVPVKRSINYLSEYLECTPPPPPIFDLHPKACSSTFDCFPNVCCQEAGKKHCRPPKKSVLTFMANFLNLGLVKRLTKNLVIK